jgi:hypothetical protein
MAKVAKIWDGTAWVDLATSVPNLSNYQLKSESGLQFVKKQTIGTAVSSVTVTDAFSATYDAYKIIIGGTGVGSTASNLGLRLGASTTQYYSAGYNNTYAGSGTTLAVNNGASFTYSGLMRTEYMQFDVDLVNPAVAKFTQYKGGFNNNLESAFQTGLHQVATAYTDFTISPSSGTMTGGTIYVYGYNKG